MIAKRGQFVRPLGVPRPVRPRHLRLVVSEPAPVDVPLPISPVAAAAIVALAMAGGLCLWVWLFVRMLS